jgi:branched-chain amino acid transport system permease protein
VAVVFIWAKNAGSPTETTEATEGINMSSILDLLVFGTSLSALYMLIAVGFTLIFSIGGIANLAHGAFLMGSAYIVFFSVGEGVPLIGGIVIGIIAVALGATMLYANFFRPLRDQLLTAMIVTFLVGFLIEDLVGVLYTFESRSIPPIVDGVWRVSGTAISYNRVLSTVVALICFAGVWYFVSRTTTGQAILATSIDRKAAASLGIPVTRMEYVVWGIAGGLAAIAGYFWGTFGSISPSMGFQPMLVGFIIVIIGGLGSVFGAFIASFLIGMLETGAALYIDPGAQGLFSFGVLILVMLVRPEGLLGKRELTFE